MLHPPMAVPITPTTPNSQLITPIFHQRTFGAGSSLVAAYARADSRPSHLLSTQAPRAAPATVGRRYLAYGVPARVGTIPPLAPAGPRLVAGLGVSPAATRPHGAFAFPACRAGSRVRRRPLSQPP